MNTYRGSGHRRTHTPSGADIASGGVVVMGSEIGVAVDTIIDGNPGAVEVSGLHELAAKSADTWDAGDPIYWDATEEELTDTSTDNTLAGVANTAKLAAEVLHTVLLNGRCGQE